MANLRVRALRGVVPNVAYEGSCGGFLGAGPSVKKTMNNCAAFFGRHVRLYGYEAVKALIVDISRRIVLSNYSLTYHKIVY